VIAELTAGINAVLAGALVNMKDYAYSAGVCPAGSSTFSGLTVTCALPASG
jgi:hypothetical protein